MNAMAVPPRSAATGFASSSEARPDNLHELAAQAVGMALERCGTDVARGIVLLLTPHFARAPQAAVTAAARAGRCLQVVGATCPGIFTEQAWTLDQPAAAALVLNGDIALVAPDPAANAPRLSFSMPDGLDSDWLRIAQPRFGALATGNEHYAISAVWNHGKWQPEGRTETELRGATLGLAVSRGMQPISEPLEVSEVDGYELLLLGDEAPLSTLLSRLPVELREEDKIPLGLIFAAAFDSDIGLERSVAEGRYSLIPILGVNAEGGTLTLGASLDAGMNIFWALRHPLSAEMELRHGVTHLHEQHAVAPDFAVMFSCIGRGPYFYGGNDHDLAVLLNAYPDLPVLGGYCGGEIAPLSGGNAVISYSTVAALAYPERTGDV